MGFIYKVTNTVNGKLYIGQTSRTIEVRWREHIHDAIKRNNKSSFIFHKAIKKYGPNAFEIEQIEECDSSMLDERERYWIKYYDTYNNGYNADFGGRSNRGHPIYQYTLDGKFIRGFATLGDAQQAIGRTISLAACRQNTSQGGYIWRRYKVDKLDVDVKPYVNKKPVHQYSIDGYYIKTHNSLREAALEVRGRKTGTMIGAACRGRYDTVYGYRWSFEKVDKLPPFEPYKPERMVMRMSLDGTDKKIYNSIKDAAKENNVCGPNIIEVCKGKSKTCGGFHWEYFDNQGTIVA